MSKKIPRNALSAKAKKRTRQHEVVDGGANKNPIWRFCCLDKDIPAQLFGLHGSIGNIGQTEVL